MPSIDLEECVHRACLLEASARKPGNVHPGASFEHISYDDFVRSGEAIAPVVARVAELGVGKTILEAVEATQEVCKHNTNLGIILLLTPLAAVPPEDSLVDGVADVLKNLTREDAEHVFSAINLARPRGLGVADDQDVTEGKPQGTLKEVMELAAERDLIARQYATDFESIIKRGVDVLSVSGHFEENWEQTIVHLHIDLMSRTPDTDILRKCGKLDATESSRKAAAVRSAGWPLTFEGRLRLREFDRWLRAKGSLRNPGTTADLVTATVFAALREGRISSPPTEEIQRHVSELASSDGNLHLG